MKLAIALAVFVAVGVAMPVSAADVTVSYDVDYTALKKGASFGAVLSFELYSDNNCTVQTHQQDVTVEAVDSIVRPKLLRVKSAPKVSKVARMQHVLSGVTLGSESYLKVVGTGILPRGRECQPQAAAVTGTVPPVRSKGVEFSHNSSEGTGTQAVSGVGFQPTSVILYCGIANVAYTTAASAALVDENGDWGRLNLSDVDTSSVSGGGFVVDVNPDGLSATTATLVSLDANGFTLNWGQVDHDVRCFALALR